MAKSIKNGVRIIKAFDLKKSDFCEILKNHRYKMKKKIDLTELFQKFDIVKSIFAFSSSINDQIHHMWGLRTNGSRVN